MIDIVHFFVLITDQGHKFQLWKTAEFKLLPYLTATLTHRLPKVTWARKQDYSTVNLYLHWVAIPFRLNKLWLPLIRELSHIPPPEPRTQAWYLIFCLRSFKHNGKVYASPLLEAKWSGSHSYTFRAAESWAIVRWHEYINHPAVWLYKGWLYCFCFGCSDLMFVVFLFFFFFNSLVPFEFWRSTHLNVQNLFWKLADIETPKLWLVIDKTAWRHT